MKKILQFILLLTLINANKANAQSFSWAHNFGGADNDLGSRIAVDANSNSYLTGSFSGTAMFGSSVLTSNGGTDAFIAKYDVSGSALWAIKIGGAGNEEGTAICIDPNGDIFIAGVFASSTITIGASTLTNSGGDDIFAVKFSPAGNILGTQKAGGSGYEKPLAITTSATGEIFITGYFAGIGTSCSFGSITLTGTGASSMFIAKYDVTGTVAWAQKAGGLTATGNVRGVSIGVDVTGAAYVCGRFSTGADFVIQQLTAIGNTDMFLAKYNPGGTLSSVAQYYGTTGAQIQPTAMQTDGSGFCYIAGYFVNNITLGSTTLINSGMADVFVTKINALGIVQWAAGAGGSADDKATGVVFDAAGNAYLSGSFDGNFNFGSIPVTGNSGTQDVFTAKYNATASSWQWVLTGGNSGNEYGNDIGFDGGNNLVITGQSDTPFSLGSNSIGNAGLNDGFIANVSTLTEINNSVADNKFSVFPNPADNVINIDFGNEKISNGVLQLISSSGKIVFEKSFNHTFNHEKIFLKKINSGTYTVKVISDRLIMQQQLIITN